MLYLDLVGLNVGFYLIIASLRDISVYIRLA